MNLTQYIYFDFFTIGSLIPSLSVTMLGYFFLVIKNKSKASFHIGMGLLCIGIFNVGYIISSTFYHPMAAFHRWLTVGIILIAETHFCNFMFHYPFEKRPKIAKIMLIIQYAVGIVITGIFFIKTAGAEKVFRFDGHYWDFIAEQISKTISLFIILYIVIFLVLMLWRFFTTKSRERWMVLFIGISYLVATIVPSITNNMSRDGALDRETFQITWNLFNLVGFFLVAIFYMNSTKDRSSFMSKILIVTVTTLLLMVQGFTYYSLQDQEKSFDQLLESKTHLSIKTDIKPKDMKYMAEYSFQDRAVAIKYIKDNNPLTLNFSGINQEFHNTLIYEKISNIDESKFKEELEEILSGTDKFFFGYKAAILEYYNTINPDEKNPAGKILAYIDSLERNILFTRTKISQIPEKNFTDQLKVFLPGARTKIFNEIILKHIETAGSDTKNLKQDILTYLTPMRKPGARIYRKDADEKNHYIAVMEADSVNNKVIEAGYPYLNYRVYVHDTSKKYLILLLIMVGVIIVGFPFFFWGSLVKPIRNLLAGLQEMQQGNLKVQIPVKVEDEFGYMSRNFNTMAVKIHEATENLEDKVKARTGELQAAMEEMEAMNDQLVEARDALWGEMELAKKIQTKLLPVDPVIADYDISAHMEPADEVGGDYYDIINAAGIDWIVIGDVSGHGVPAGLVMMMTQTAIHVVLAQNPDIAPDKLLDIVNATISDNIKRLGEDKYMTISVLAATVGGKFIFSGLHQDIMIFRAATGKVDLIETRGMWIGIVDDIKGMLDLDSLSMSPGDTMLLYSDGITEAVKKETENSSEPELFGDVHLADLFKKSASLPVDGIKDAILKNLQGYNCGDDVTMVILKRKV